MIRSAGETEAKKKEWR